MITRIIKLHLKPECVEEFKEFIDPKIDKIRQIPGCQLIDILADKENPSTWFIYTIWDSSSYISKYIRSEINRELMRQAPQWLAKDLQAWTVENVDMKKNKSEK